MLREDLRDRLFRMIRHQTFTSYYLNGPPGSGKSRLLNWLSNELQEEFLRCVVIGPLDVAPDKPEGIRSAIRASLAELGLAGNAGEGEHGTLSDLWTQVLSGQPRDLPRTFVCLLELPSRLSDAVALQRLFSDIRMTEALRPDTRSSVHHLIAGSWFTAPVRRVCDDVNISFPYSEDRNNGLWTGVALQEIMEMVREDGRSDLVDAHGPLLREITGGHPSAAKDILARVATPRLSVSEIMRAARESARDGHAAARLGALWTALPPASRELLGHVLTWGAVRVGGSDVDRPLRESGLCATRMAGSAAYLTMSSWYVEIAARARAAQIGVDEVAALRAEHLVPNVHALNELAYRRICELENLARNAVVAWLSRNDRDSKNVFKGKFKRLDPASGNLVDLDERTRKWRRLASENGLASTLAPQMAFCTTRDLADVIGEIADDTRSEAWRSLSNALTHLAGVRDQVMHAQILGDSALGALNMAETDIYASISRIAP